MNGRPEETPMRRCRVATVGVLAALACGGSPAEPFPGYASVQAGSDCGPAGGAAVSLVFRPAPDSIDAMGPQLRFRIYRGLGEVTGRSYASTDDPPAGTSFECSGPGPDSCTELASWRARFERLEPDSTLTGAVEVTAPDGTTRSGSFRARWQQRTLLCM
jgi:hypothetical protein